VFCPKLTPTRIVAANIDISSVLTVFSPKAELGVIGYQERGARSSWPMARRAAHSRPALSPIRRAVVVITKTEQEVCNMLQILAGAPVLGCQLS
jgi:hypothetical protein